MLAASRPLGGEMTLAAHALYHCWIYFQRDYLDNLSCPTTYFLYKKSGTLRFLLS